MCIRDRADTILREGVDCAIVGRPNAGKSTLLNLGSRCFHRCGRLFHGDSGNFRGSLLHRSSLGRCV